MRKPKGHNHRHGEQCAACEGGMEAVLADARRSIMGGQWKVFGVLDQPPFAYTAGLTQLLDMPELLLVGLPYPDSGHYLNEVVRRIKTGRIVDTSRGVRIPELFGEYDGMFHPLEIVPEGTGRPRVALDLYGARVKLIQVLFPDAQGRFPGEEHCAKSVARQIEVTRTRPSAPPDPRLN